MIAAVIDGLMAIATLAMIFVYSTQLALVVLAAFVLYAVVRLALYRVLRERSLAVIETKAQENSTFIETMRAVQSLKIFNRESERETQWLNRYADVVSANVRLGRTKIAFTSINDCLFGLENIITIYLAARLALGNSLTIGMIFAFMSYKQHFIEKAVQLVEKALDFRILELHLERLADIALSPLEPGMNSPCPTRGRSRAGSSFETCPSNMPKRSPLFSKISASSSNRGNSSPLWVRPVGARLPSSRSCLGCWSRQEGRC